MGTRFFGGVGGGRCEAGDAPVGEIAWGRRVGAGFKRELIAVAGRLEVEPDLLMAVIAFETGRSFSPSIRNPKSGATGLIQFIESTARGLGTSTTTLAAMSAEAQLGYVEAYLRPFRGRLTDLPSLYMAVLWPRAVAAAPAEVLFAAPRIAYRQNSGLDHDDDGRVTKGEATAPVQRLLIEGLLPENFG